MATPTEADIRSMLEIQDTETLSSARITLAINDAVNRSNSSDEVYLRYFAAYLIAKWWAAIKDTIEIEDTKFTIPKPEYFKELMQERQTELAQSSSSIDTVPFSKVSVSPDFSYDQTTNAIRPRKGGDNYY